MLERERWLDIEKEETIFAIRQKSPSLRTTSPAPSVGKRFCVDPLSAKMKFNDNNIIIIIGK